jgi:ABC-type antimicrobial peptide transport system permease subunit
VGGIVGIGMGVGLTGLAQMVPAVQALLSGVFTLKMFLQALAIALLLGALGGIYPAWRSAQLQPVDAMRYESGATTSERLHIPWLARLFSGGSLRNLWRRPTRTLITVVGIGIGVGFIVALMAMTDGFVVTFNHFANAGKADLLAEEANSSDVSFSKIDERVAIRILGEPEVESVSKIIIGMSATPGLAYFMVFGVDTGEEYINHYQMSEGNLISRPHEIMIGRFAATGLKKGVGDDIHLGGTNFTIVGIYETGSAFEDASGTISLKDAQALLGKPRNVTMLGIRLKEEYRSQTDEVAEKLEAEYPELFVSKSAEFAQNLQDMATTYAVLNALIVLTVVVGGIVMMNAMLMSVFERTQEIGVLRALGWRRRQVVWMVIVESMAVSCLSAVVGMGIGVGLNYLFTLDPSLGGFLTPSYSPRLFIEVFALAVILGTVGGIYPAWRAAGLRPVDALRYE